MKIVVRWGDCDEAGIVYYPNYLRWVNSSFHSLLEKAGFDARLLRRDLKGATPLVEIGATFKSSLSYNAELEVIPRVSEWGRSSFKIEYIGKSGDVTVFTAYEVRVWLSYLDENTVKPAPIPQEFREKLSDGRLSG